MTTDQLLWRQKTYFRGASHNRLRRDFVPRLSLFSKVSYKQGRRCHATLVVLCLSWCL